MSINLTGKKLAVIGSRDFDDKKEMYRILTQNLPKIKLIVSGGARGADTLATDWAADYGVPYLVFPALWHDRETGVYDRGAGFRRNRQIIEHSDIIFAFWDGVSGGTKNSLDMAKEMKKDVRIFKFTPKPKTPGENIAEIANKELESDRKKAIEQEKSNRAAIEAEQRAVLETQEKEEQSAVALLQPHPLVKVTSLDSLPETL